MSLPNDNVVNKLSVPSDYKLSAAEWRGYLDLVKTSLSDRAYYPDLCAGLRLGIRGIEEDEKENHDEAVKLYEESREHLQQCFNLATKGSDEWRLIHRQRGHLGDRMLLIQYFQRRRFGPVDLSNSVALLTARNLSKKAVIAEDNKNNKEALHHLRECEKYLLRYLEYEIRPDAAWDVVRNKVRDNLKNVTTRAKELEAIVMEEEMITNQKRLMNSKI